MYIEKINEPKDLKNLQIEELAKLADEMREALLIRASKHAGHFGPNFGIVEATIAIHYVFDSPKDKIVYDVSHQCYPHKMLTGRKDAFLYEEHYNDVTGFTNPKESEHDFFTIGHTSTSISLACGLAKARDLQGKDGNVIAIIGDGSLSGGEALEGLDYATELDGNLIIVVNDNDMSIAENHGGLYGNLKLLRDTNGEAECNLFKAMGLDYVYVKDGNDIAQLVEAFKKVKDTKKQVVVHINTLKGKGYVFAEEDKENWHFKAPFDVSTGKVLFVNKNENYPSITKDYLLKKMKEDKSVVAITSGTPTVFGFDKEARQEAKSQFVDVGIAEETAVAVASGIAANGGKPVYGVSSTFLQRAYDQITQDLCLDNNPATILTFGGSVYGMTGVTHIGLQDIPMLGNIPNLVYLAPTTKEEYLAMLEYSINQTDYSIAIKVPGGAVVSDNKEVTKDFSQINKYEIVSKGSKVAIIGLGNFFTLAKETAKLLTEQHNITPTLINPYYITGIDEELLSSLCKDHSMVITLEDGFLSGGFGEKIARFYGKSDVKVLNLGIKTEFIDINDVNETLRDNHLTKEQIVSDILEVL